MSHITTPAPLPSARTGHVSLVGAGPGDPDLLTVRALRALQQADYVLYDRLVPAAILALAPQALHEYVGKQAGLPGSDQAAINQRLLEIARRYPRVVRLKGGDPFIFGRGGEEILALQAHGVSFDVIPGITAALGCAAATAIPLTHRGLAHQVTFVTAHRAADHTAHHWPALAAAQQTVVFYMGVAELPAIQRALLAHGRAPTIPAALIENGSLPSQRVFISTLAELASTAAAVGLQSPALVIIGEVVSLADTGALGAAIFSGMLAA
jgi:uroporphyrin-III C-methyltransferase